MRCVEGWSAVIPWAGFSFNELLKRVEPTGNAKFVEFWSLADPNKCPTCAPFLDWPYIEAIRLDEARHPLTLFALGMYGEVMPKQNGAPAPGGAVEIRFQGAKSIVRIRFVEKQPETVVDQGSCRRIRLLRQCQPDVPIRWSQSHERRLGEFVKRKTLPFNGYAEQVAALYAGMDLRKYF